MRKLGRRGVRLLENKPGKKPVRQKARSFDEKKNKREGDARGGTSKKGPLGSLNQGSNKRPKDRGEG